MPARRDTPDPSDANDVVEQLREPLAQLQGALEQLREPLSRIAGTSSPSASPNAFVPQTPADKVTFHIRRYLPLYALATVWALMLVLVPTVNERGGGPATVGAISDTGGDGAFGDFADDTFAADDTITPGAEGATAAAAVGSRGAARRGASGGAGGSGTIGKVLAQTGTTRGGFECKPGVRQIPWSQYAHPCIAKFEGGNGGATYRGVTDDTIRIAVRATADDGGPNSQAVDEVNKSAGRATQSEALAILKQYVKYFNTVYELYGRKVELVEWGSQVSNGTDEAQSKGREAACADAKALAENVKVFGVIALSTSFIESEPFSECASREGLFVPQGAAYFPEQYYQRWHPHVFNTVMECERIARDVGEYVGKRLAFKQAKWAADPALRDDERVFGVYVPDNDGYQYCVDIYDGIAEAGGYKTKSRVDYVLDVSRFADQAAAAILQFKADGVTTLVNACDPISTIFLTQAAQRNQYGPEWLLIGVAAQDTEGYGRLYEKEQVRNSLFGMSQLGSDARIFGKDGEAYRTWKTMQPNAEPPRGFGTIYFAATHIFNLLQSAGPNLTPQTIAQGVKAMPAGGGERGAVGTWSFKESHTAIVDSREIYWDPNAKAFDGGTGAYIETYGGKRFKSGQWPKEDPPIYPSA